MNPDGQVEPITTDALHLESGSPCFKELGDEEGGGIVTCLVWHLLPMHCTHMFVIITYILRFFVH